MPTKTTSKSAPKSSAKTPAKADAKDAKKAPAKKEPEPKSTSKIAAAAPAKPAAKPEPKPEPKRADLEPKRPSSTRIEVEEARATTATASKDEPMTLPRIAAAAPVAEERPSITTTMSKTQLQRFRKLLEEKREDIVRKAKQTLDEDMTLDASDLPDEMDLASSEYLQSFTFRLRGREKSFLDKINKALERIDNGTFGVCEECGDEISIKRLEARPETTLCIRCKEDQERAEKDYG